MSEAGVDTSDQQKPRYPDDTSPEARRRWVTYLRSLTITERGALTVALIEAANAALEQHVRGRFPQADDREVLIRMVVRLHGRAMGKRVFGLIPDDAR